MNKEFFIKNRERLGEKLKDNSITILFAGEAPYKSADETYTFTPNRNFYYLTGIDRPKMILMMVKRKDKVTETLFIEKNDPVMAKWVGEKMSEAEAKEISGIENISFVEEFEGTVANLLGRTDIGKFYLDFERQEFHIPMTRAQKFAAVLRERYPYVKVKNVFHKICEQRLIKTDEEVENIKKAIEVTYEGIKEMWKNSTPGMKEYEIEAYFDFTLKKNGVTDFAFHTIAAAGKNATVLHYGDNNCETKDGDLMLLDLGADTHDVGSRELDLMEGMVLTVEPGLYIEEENIGIRIEDDILVTKDGYENLSSYIIKTIEEIENFMADDK